MQQINRERVFIALTRPQMFAGVTYSFFVMNMIVAAEMFLIFKSLWILIPSLLLHGFAMLLSMREPRIIDLWLIRARYCGRVPNHGLWRCNSYRP